MRRKVTIIAIVSVVGAALLAQIAIASGQSYTDRRRIIRAGVLVSTLSDSPMTPYIFFLMGQRDDLKPQGWGFANPLGGGQLSMQYYADYWKVPLDTTTLENLNKFDVLYLNSAGGVAFLKDQRDKLRRYVDGGGCLWIDNGRAMRFADAGSTAFFLPGVNFKLGGGGNPSVIARLHALVTNPFWLGPQELASMDAVRDQVIDPGFTRDFSAGTLPNPTILSPIVGLAGMGGDIEPTVAAVEYGSGRVVMTSGYVGGAIQNPTILVSSLPAALSSQNCNPYLANPSSLRFAYNVIGWASSSTTFRKNYRHTGESLESIGAPLENKWKIPTGLPPNGGSPAIYKNVIFYTAGGTLYALDAVPDEDLDMDGNPDDGLDDAPSGPGLPGYDIIWQAPIGGTISSPTVVTMLDPKGGSLMPKDFVMVTSNSGGPLVQVFEALPVATGPGPQRLSGVAVPRTDLWPSDSGGAPTGSGLTTPLPPVVQNGWIYAVGPQGCLYGHSPVLAEAANQKVTGPGTPWHMYLSGSPTQAVTITQGPTFGFVKNASNGAIVQNLFVVGRPYDDGTHLFPNDCIYALPVYVASDRLAPVNQRSMYGAGSTISFYLSSQFRWATPSSYPPPEVWAVNGDGTPFDVSISGTPTAGKLDVTTTGQWNPNVRVYLNYAIDYSVLVDGAISIPYYQIGQQIRSVISGAEMSLVCAATPALGQNDCFYMGENFCALNSTSPMTGRGGTGQSSVDSVWYDGNRGMNGQVRWHYFLHGGGLIPDPTTAAGVGATPVDLNSYDPTTGESTSPWGIWGVQAPVAPSGPDPRTRLPVPNLQVKCTPAIAGDRIFVTAATAVAPADPRIAHAYLLCFKAQPQCQVRITRPLIDPATGRRLDVRIWQPDMIGDALASGSAPPVQSAKSVPADMIDYSTGTITITDFSRIQMQMMLTSGGSPVSASGGILSTSLPVWVYVDNQPVSPGEVDLTSWDSLLWAMPVPEHATGGQCTGISSSPVVMGDYVYFTCDDGYMYAVAVGAVPTDAGYKILDPKSTTVKVDTWMPMQQQIDGVAPITGNTAPVSMAGAGGVLAVPTSRGLYVFGSSHYLIADNHRIIEIGSDGKVTWLCDSVNEAKAASGVSQTSGGNTTGFELTSLNKPVVAQKMGPLDYLVVDSGNDRVIHIDRGGQVLWSLTSFEDPLKLLRSGESKSIKAPSDAKMWDEIEEWTDPVTGDKANYYVRHCMVADTGNFRIVDLVDRYALTANGPAPVPSRPDANGRPIHELRWVSSTTYRDQRYTFNSIQVVKGLSSDGTQIVSQVWAAVGNYGLGSSSYLDTVPSPTPGETSSPGGGHTGGAIVGMDYRNVNYDSANNSTDFVWQYQDSGVTKQVTSVMDGTTPIPLSGPTYLEVLDPALPKLLICDSSAVYVTTGPDASVTWKLTGEGYSNLTRKVTVRDPDDSVIAVPTLPVASIPFNPHRARMLSDGKILIVNSYAGQMRDALKSKFVGEVFETDAAASTIYWYTPDMTFYPNTPADVPPDGIGQYVQKMLNAPNLDQPTDASLIK